MATTRELAARLENDDVSVVNEFRRPGGDQFKLRSRVPWAELERLHEEFERMEEQHDPNQGFYSIRVRHVS